MIHMREILRQFMRPLTFATGAVLVATLLAYGGRWFWTGELLVNFRVHFAMLLALALVVASMLRQWRVASLAAAGLALNAWPMYGAFFASATPASIDARLIRVAAFNVHIANDDPRAIASYLESLTVDVAVLEELSQSNSQALAELLPTLPHRYFAERDGVWGVAIFSRWPLIAPQPAARYGVTFAVRADIDLGDRQLRLYGAHLNWPLVPASERIRNLQLWALGHELSQCPQACVAVGDFNVTPWSSHFRDVLKHPGVRDCAAGRGLLYTWASGLPAPLRIRIDQCLAAGDVNVADVRVGESMGSDHFATVNDLLIGADHQGTGL